MGIYLPPISVPDLMRVRPRQIRGPVPEPKYPTAQVELQPRTFASRSAWARRSSSSSCPSSPAGKCPTSTGGSRTCTSRSPRSSSGGRRGETARTPNMLPARHHRATRDPLARGVTPRRSRLFETVRASAEVLRVTPGRYCGKSLAWPHSERCVSTRLRSRCNAADPLSPPPLTRDRPAAPLARQLCVHRRRTRDAGRDRARPRQSCARQQHPGETSVAPLAPTGPYTRARRSSPNACASSICASCSTAATSYGASSATRAISTSP